MYYSDDTIMIFKNLKKKKTLAEKNQKLQETSKQWKITLNITLQGGKKCFKNLFFISNQFVNLDVIWTDFLVLLSCDQLTVYIGFYFKSNSSFHIRVSIC